MQYETELTPAQLRALYTWADTLDGGQAPITIADSRDGDGVILVGQGDDRVSITPEGTVIER